MMAGLRWTTIVASLCLGLVGGCTSAAWAVDRTPVRLAAGDQAPDGVGLPSTLLASLGPLAGRIELGRSGPWTGRAENGRLVLTNAGQAGAVRYYDTDWQGNLSIGRSVAVRVKASGTGQLAAAGLILHITDDDPRWIAWVVTPEHRIALYIRRANELQLANSTDIPGGSRPEGDLLQVNEKGDTAELLVNGHLVTSLPPSKGKSATEPFPVGVVGLGTGEFTFGDFGFGSYIPTTEAPIGKQASGDDTVPLPTPAPQDPRPRPMAPRPGSVDLPSLGPIGKGIFLGRDRAWTKTQEDGRLVYSNDSDDDALEDRTVDWEGSLQAGRSVGVRVGIEGASSQRGAGLVFADNAQDSRFLAWIVTGDKAALYKFENDRLDVITTAPLPAGLQPGGNVLQVSQSRGETSILIDGHFVQRLTDENGRAADVSGKVGIVVIGKGRFSFSDFAFGPALATGNAAGPAGPRRQPDAKPSAQLDPFTADVLGATIGIMAHEFGHYMIGELKVPATGPEEDVADEFASMVFIDNLKDDPALAAPMALGNAKLWWFMSEEHGDKGPPWYDEHAPDRARFAKFMCMLYGAAPPVFQPVMDATGIPKRTQQRCLLDEPKHHLAWDTLLRTHRRRGVDPLEVGDLDPTTPGAKITVEYQEPKDPNLRGLAELFVKSRAFDQLAVQISKLYVLPRNTKIVFRDCGMENCFYNPDDGSVTMCWEMLAFVIKEFQKHQQNTADTAGNAPPDQPQPPPAQPPQPQPVSQPHPEVTPVQFLIGRWHTLVSTPTGMQDNLVDFGPRNTYRGQSRMQSMQGIVTVNIEGQWSIRPAGGSRFRLTLTPRRWFPQQICQASGYCLPVNLMPQARVVEFVDRNTVRSDVGVSTRIQ